MSSRSERSTAGWVRGIVVGLGLASAFATASAAQEQPTATQAATAAEQPAAAKAEEQPKGGMGEGIKVHGHWTIDIKNPDGTLVGRHEFENALLGGQRPLAALLARRLVGISWAVLVGGGFLQPNPCDSSFGPRACWVTEPSYPANESNMSKNLQLVVPTDSLGAPTGTVQLTGYATASQSASISRVSTVVAGTLNDGQGTAVETGSAFEFTVKDLPTPIPVGAGQIIQVTVIFSFS